MGKRLTRYGRASLVLLAAAFFALTNYSCQQPAPSTNQANGNQVGAAPAATQPAAQLTPSPYPATFPQELPTPVVSGQIPLAVPLPSQINNPLQLRPFFDYFSWESFIALNWPAAAGQRGQPDRPNDDNVFLKAAAGTPVVWNTYKTSLDLFGTGTNRPSPWSAPDTPSGQCPAPQPGQQSLVFMSKGNTPLMDVQQAFSYPLVDQRGNYVFYDVRYNQAFYEFVRGQEGQEATYLYLLKNLQAQENTPTGVQMPMTSPSPSPTVGAIMIKSAWRIKTDRDDASRYYTTTAQVVDPLTEKCTQQTALLVGLHIAHKVSPFSEWVWSTFEQVDNVPPDAAAGGGPTPTPPPNGYSFNNGTNQPAAARGYSYRPPNPPSVGGSPTPTPTASPTPLVPVQVLRLNPIPNTPAGQSTREVNAYYQQLLRGTVWQYYQLVVTQWPFNFSQFKLMQDGGVYPADAGGAFPVNGAVNTTMETYFQSQSDAAGAGGNSCMSCHYRAGQSDFSWGLNRRAR